ncbi:hypothetical protein MKK84_05405 [Methylobacterium sp. E-065]|uniref:hypothetical protein n=1 Tax=Methylobacterium sp. E-065 TaxID=2836583 RepID=UPI001FBC13C2|nr:hypothetical protein [Methylobacterium sp. E-065]MCJ2016869.1 hypothetical protein [Methylobacterium sp. E-065]
MADAADSEIEYSPLCGWVTRDGVTVQVHIFRSAGTSDEWTLEVVDQVGTSTVWKELFPDDQSAFEDFERAASEDGMRSFSLQQHLH